MRNDGRGNTNGEERHINRSRKENIGTEKKIQGFVCTDKKKVE
jgi:hypothetical protein